jgi:hypothetical protein
MGVQKPNFRNHLISGITFAGVPGEVVTKITLLLILAIENRFFF